MLQLLQPRLNHLTVHYEQPLPRLPLLILRQNELQIVFKARLGSFKLYILEGYAFFRFGFGDVSEGDYRVGHLGCLVVITQLSTFAVEHKKPLVIEQFGVTLLLSQTVHHLAIRKSIYLHLVLQ